MAIPETDYLGRLGSVIEQRGLPSQEKKALIAEADRQPAGKRPSAAEIVKDTTEIMEGLKPMIDSESLKAMFKKPENLSRAQKILEDAASGKVNIPDQYQEASDFLSKFGDRVRARKDVAKLAYDEQIEEAVKMLREEEQDEPLSWGDVAGRVALVTAPALIGGLMGAGVGAGAGKGILYGLEEAEKAKEAKKERLRKITEFGLTSKLKKAAGEVEGLSDIEQEIEKARAKVPISYAEAAAELQRLGAKGIENLSKDQLGAYLELLPKVVMKLMERDKEGKQDKPKILTSEQVSKLAGFNNAIAQVNDIREAVKKNAGIMGPFLGGLKRIPYATETRTFDAKMKLAAQKIGVALEGGKLTDADIDRYRDMLPNIDDTPEVAEGKIENILTLIQQSQANELSILAGAGYDVSKIQASPQSATLKEKTTESPGPDFKRVKQNGKEFWFNPKTKESILIK